MSRNYRFDTIKCILIALVVFGHLLELIEGESAEALYHIIYLFHIPAFIFITGYFAKFHPSKILFSFIMPYILLQILYLTFHAFVIQGKDSVTLQFTKPYWLLWYLMTVCFYYLLIPFFHTKNKRRQIFIVLVSVTVSLFAGLDKNIGYFLSLSRFFSFLPFFLTGYYLAQNHKTDAKNHTPDAMLFPKLFSHSNQNKSIFSVILPLFALTGAIVSIFYIVKTPLSYQVLYGAYSYEAMHYGAAIKCMLYLFASCWIILLLTAAPAKKIPLLSAVGKYTFPVFVLHGFVVKLADKYHVFSYSETQNLLLAFIITIALIILLGNKYSSLLFQTLFTGRWIQKFYFKS